jgi:TPP-dependent pyruvate/acetoin dehydrogenase alpha subunit
MRSSRFADKVSAYDIPSMEVDGNDFDAMYNAISTGIARAREGGGPTVIEADTMRMLGHAIHDGAEYVPPHLLEHWRSRDPVSAFRARLIEEGEATEEQLEAIDRAARTRITAAIAAAQAAPMPDPSSLHEGVWA